MGVQFQILGGLAATRAGVRVGLGGRKQRAVLAALLADLGRAVPPDRLQDLVWGDRPPANPETSLQAYISNLRRSLEPERRPREAPRLLVTQPTGYALLAKRDDVDAARFEDLVHAGLRALARGDHAATLTTLDRALATWTGTPLPELAGQPWVDDLAAHLGRLRADAVEARIDAGLALGEHATLAHTIEQAVAEEPFRERRRAQLALALYRSGRQREALAAIADARRVLAEEVGVEPGPELRKLEADILAQAPDLLLPAAASVGPAPASPAATDARPCAPRRRSTDRPPAATEGPTGPPFVGRARELDVLLDAAAAAARGTGRPVVVSGEPGIGKTRLVEEAVARLPDAVVAWGRCPESAAGAAYWPCIEIGRQLEGADALDADLLASLLPAAPPPDLRDDPAADRLGLHVAVAEVLASARQLLVLVVDDLQWADPSSLRVIEHIAGALHRTQVLLVATVRTGLVDPPAALVDCLAELARQPGAARLDLSPLATDDVQRWIGARGGRTASDDVAQLVHDRSGGNPFFVGEVVELLATEGRLGDPAAARAAAVPAAVQDVVRRRISRLPSETQALLPVASVVGRTFDVDVLAGVAARDPAAVLDHLDAALSAGVLEDTDVPGRLQFSHALVADTIASELGPGRRARLHAATARVLAELRAADVEGQLAALAHHALAGAAAGTAPEAYEWSVRAARRAASQLAHEDAVGHWAQALRALELARPGDRRGRYDVLLEQGRAHLRIDQVAEGFRALGAAVELALALGDRELVARAAVSMHVGGLWQAGEIGLTRVDAVGVLERALEVLPSDDAAARALVLSAVAENAYWLRSAAELDALTAEAVELARASGDATVLGQTLHRRQQAMWRADTFEQREATASELLELVESQPVATELEAIGRFGAAAVDWERGEVNRAVSNVQHAQRLARQIGSPALMTQLDFFEGTIAAFQGRLTDAEALVERGYELYRRTRRWIADALHAGLMGPIWADRFEPDRLRATKGPLLDNDYRPWFKEGYAAALVRVGQLDEAAEIAAEGVPPLVDCWLYLGMLAAAVQVRVAVGDRDAADQLAARLAPYEGRLAVSGTGPPFGDVHLQLAQHALMVGDEAAARRHLDASVRLLRRAGGASLLVDALLLRAEAAPEGAADDLDEAALVAQRHGIPRSLAQLESLARKPSPA